MKNKDLEIRLQLAEKAINGALNSLSDENIKQMTEEEDYKEYTMNMAMGYARAVGSALANLQRYSEEVKEIEEI